MLSFTPSDLGFVRRVFQNRALMAFLVLFFCCPIPWAKAITTSTCGPFTVSFYGSGESYTDSQGTTYTGSTNWTSTEMDDVASMIQVWDSGILNAAGPRQIKLNLMWNDITGGDFLGISSSFYTGNNTTAWTNAERLWRTGVDVSNPSYPDVFIRFDSTTSWNFGLGAPSSSTWDFRSTVTHEIGHALGFFSTYISKTDSPDYDKWSNYGITAWDSHLRDTITGNNAPIANGYGTQGNFNQTANPVYFDGTNANAANGGNRAAIYAPSSYVSGSSLTHLNESTFSSALMSPALYDGEMVRQPTYLEWQMMRDMGWNLDTSTKAWTNGEGDLQWASDNNWTAYGTPLAIQTAAITNSGLSSGATIILGGNYPVGSLSFNTTTTFSIGGTEGTLTIATGVVTRSASSSGTQTIARPIALGANAIWDLGGSGSLNVSQGISGNYSLEKRGAGTLNLSGANTYTGTTRVQNGEMIISGGSTASTAFDVYAGKTLSFSGGNYSMGGATFTNAGTININGGTVTFNAATSISGTVNFSSGTIAGTDLLTFTNPLSWTGGTMSGSGTTKLQLGMNVSSGGTLTLNGRTLLNVGTTTFSANTLHGKNGAIINNQSGATVELLGSNDFIQDSGTLSRITNAGTFRKKTSAGIINIGFALDNTGTVQVQTGTLNLAGGGSSTGTFSVSPGAFLAFKGGTHYLGGATFGNSGEIDINGATAAFNAATLVPGTVNFSSGTLSGTGTVTFSGPLTWTNGTMSGSGTQTTNAQGGIIFSGGGDPLLNGRILNNSGTATFSSNTYLFGSNGAVVNNLSTALIDLRGVNYIWDYGDAAPTLNNYGTLRKSADTGDIGISFDMNNIGTVDVQSGGLSFQDVVTQLAGGTLTGGTWNVRSNAQLDFDLGGYITTNQGNVTLDGPGSTFYEIDPLADNRGGFSVLGGRNFTTFGNLANSGALTVGAGSYFSVNGDLTGTGTIAVSGQLMADSIVQNTLTIRSGGRVTIRPIAGGTLGREVINAVPEPGTIILLLMAGAALLLYKMR
jgi:autotransporter-associated beta strand protein